jgi:NAD(P)-dependent dehydrogenase (short-subunit alcohol dehydrogenase family)
MSSDTRNNFSLPVLDSRLRRFGLDGKTAVVLGGAGGIGSATAMALAEHGANVAVLDVQAEQAEQVAERVRAINSSAMSLACDIQDSERLQSAIDETARRMGRIDVLVNAAGRASLKPLIEMSTSEFEEYLAVYLTAAFVASQTVAKRMIQQATGGSIVHISSISSVRALGRGTGAYGAAKAGLNAMVREMAVEWAPHRIRVNAVAPCQVKSPQFERFLQSGLHGGCEQLTQKLLSAIPLGRFGEPEEIAGPCVFLASEAASLITGQVLFVDGGNTAQ